MANLKTQHFGYQEEQLYVFRETFTGNGAATTFQLDGDVGNASFETGSWLVTNVKTGMAADVSKTTRAALYDSSNVLTRHKISVQSISSSGLVTLDYAPMAEDFYIWYWYDIEGDALSDYYRDDFVNSMEADAGVTIASGITTDVASFGDRLSATDDTVQKALDTLDDFQETFSHVKANNLIGTPTYDDLNDWFNVSQSAGAISGFTISDSGSGQIDVAAGTGYIKSTASETGANFFFNYAGTTNLDLTDDSLNWIYVSYNSGTPIVAVTVTLADVSHYDEFIIGRVYRDGTSLHIVQAGAYYAGIHHKSCLWVFEIFGFQRASGMVASHTGTRNIAITTGVFYCAFNRFTSAAFDTSAASTFNYWYHSGGNWTKNATATQIDNTYYDNGTALAELTANRYSVHWVYMGHDGLEFHVVYNSGGDYTLAQAKAALAPSEVPGELQEMSFLIAKIIIQKSASSFTSIETAFGQDVEFTTASDHGGLAGLSDDDHTQYALTDGSRTITGSMTVTGTIKLSGLTDGYIPYHVSDAAGLANSPLTTDGTNLSTTGFLEVLGATVDVGINDSVYGKIYLRGHATGSDQGGQLTLYVAADHDATINTYVVQVWQDDLLLGPGTDIDALKLTSDKDFHVTAGTVSCYDLSDGYVPYHVSDAAGLANSPIWTDGTKVGIGTATVPHGGIGAAKLAIEGTNASTAGPHVQFTTASDDYPLLQIVAYAHDNVNFAFDCYYDGSWKSADAGSNFRIAKYQDVLQFNYKSGVAQGGAVTFSTAMSVGLGNVYIYGSNTGEAPPSTGALIFDNTFDSTAFTGSGVGHTANKIKLYSAAGSWVGGIGVSTSTVNFYSGDHFKWVVAHTGESTGVAGMTLINHGDLRGQLVVGQASDTAPVCGLTLIDTGFVYGAGIICNELTTTSMEYIAFGETVNATTAYLIRYNSAHATYPTQFWLLNSAGSVYIYANNASYQVARFYGEAGYRDLYVGVSDTIRGVLELAGHGAGTAVGGSIYFYTSADYDTTINYYYIQSYEDDFLIGPSTDTDALKLTSDKDLHITAGTISCYDLTDGYVPYHVSDAAGLANGSIYTNGTNVHIGGTSLVYKFNVTVGVGEYPLYVTDGTRSGGFYINADAVWLGTISNHPLYFFTANSNQKMTLTATGLLGIACNPVSRLEVEDGATSASMLVKITQDDGNVYGLVIGNDTYSTTDTVGLRFKVFDAGNAYIEHAGTDLYVRSIGVENTSDLYAYAERYIYFVDYNWGAGAATKLYLDVQNSILSLGVSDTQYGTLRLRGQATGSNQGGKVELYTAADHDTTIDSFAVQAYEDDLWIGPSTDQDALKLTSDKDLHITAGTVSCYDLTDGYIPYHVSDAAGLANSPIWTDGTYTAVGESTVNSNHKLTVAGQFSLSDEGGGNRRFAAKATYLGYSESYRALLLGSTSTTYNTAETGAVTLAINTDPTLVSGGTFQGDGREIIIRRRMQLMIPNAGSTDWEHPVTFNEGNVGIRTDRTANPVAPLEVEDAATSASMLVKITQDDQNVYGLVIGNDTYSTTDTNGLKFKVDNSGNALVTWTAGDFTIGLDADTDALKLTSDKDLYLTDGDAYFQNAGTSTISLVASGSYVGVGVADTTVGSVRCYGQGAGQAQGGYIVAYTSADYDATIDYFQFSAYEDDLYIGSNTDTDALKLDSNKDLYITAGSLLLSAGSEYINFSATQGATGFGLRDNSGYIQVKHSDYEDTWEDIERTHEINKSVVLSEDFFGLANSFTLGWQGLTTGTGAGFSSTPISTDAAHLGTVGFATGTDTSAYCTLRLAAGSSLCSGGDLKVEWIVRISDLSDGTDTFKVHVGLGDTVDTTNFANAIAFTYTHGESSGNWECCTATTAGGETSTDSSVAVAADTWYRLTAIMSQDGATVKFYIDGALVATHTDDVPDSATLYPIAKIAKSAGTNTRYLYADAFYFRKRVSR